MGFNTKGLTIFHKPWFSGDPQNAKKASKSIGTGNDGTVTITSDLVGTEGNSYSITISTTGASGCDMSASISGKDITLVLGKTSTNLEATKNTAKLIAAEIDTLDGVSAVASGSGADSIIAGANKANFTGGGYATPCNASSAVIVVSDTIYFTDKPCTKYTENAWYSVSPTLL